MKRWGMNEAMVDCKNRSIEYFCAGREDSRTMNVVDDTFGEHDANLKIRICIWHLDVITRDI